MDEHEAMATAHRARLHALVGDLFVPPALRLNDHERALMKGALVSLTKTVIADVRRRLQPAGAILADDAERDEALAWTVVEKCRALRSLAVAEALRTLFDSHTLALGLADPSSRLAHRYAAGAGAILLDREDPAHARLIDAYHWGRAQRLDAFGNPVLSADDLPETEARALCWSVVAGLALEKQPRTVPPAGQGALQIVDGWQRSRDVRPRMSLLALEIVRCVRAQDITSCSLTLLATGAVDLWIAALADRLDAPQRSLFRVLAARRMNLFYRLLLAAGVDTDVAATLAAAAAQTLSRDGGRRKIDFAAAGAADLEALLALLRVDPELVDAQLDFRDL